MGSMCSTSLEILDKHLYVVVKIGKHSMRSGYRVQRSPAKLQTEIRKTYFSAGLIYNLHRILICRRYNRSEEDVSGSAVPPLHHQGREGRLRPASRGGTSPWAMLLLLRTSRTLVPVGPSNEQDVPGPSPVRFPHPQLCSPHPPALASFLNLHLN
jgi:hypothetical protein